MRGAHYGAKTSKWDGKQQHYEMSYLPTKTGELQHTQVRQRRCAQLLYDECYSWSSVVESLARSTNARAEVPRVAVRVLAAMPVRQPSSL
jgi:hypothetical protein